MAAACKKVNLDEIQCVQAVKARLGGESDLFEGDVCSDIFCKTDEFEDVCTNCNGLCDRETQSCQDAALCSAASAGATPALLTLAATVVLVLVFSR